MSKITEKTNPFTRDFGTNPATYITRTIQQDEIYRSFIDELTDDKVFFIVGQRGYGKSSLLRAVKEEVARNERWIVTEIRSNNDNLIHELAATLYSDVTLKESLVDMEIDFSLIGLGASITAKTKKRIEISSDEVAVKKMLETLKKQNRKVMVAIDEISDTKAIREFVSLFNVCKGEKLPIYLLMDGLYKNMTALENVPDLTFLKRVQKLVMDPLNMAEMFYSYKKHLHLMDDKNQIIAHRLAEMTKGYPYAFQLIGFYTWLWYRENENLFDDFDQYLERLNNELDKNLDSYVYQTIWTEISPTEQDILSIMAVYKLEKVQDIREKYNEVFPERAEMTSGNFSKYRDKLIKMSILSNRTSMNLTFNLPRFDIYAILNRNERIRVE